MLFNGVRVLPQIPMDMPNLENLIREFEKGLTSTSEDRKNITVPTSSSGRIVKKIVEAYELRAIENAQRKQNERRSGSVDTLGNFCNRRTFGGSTPTIYRKSAGSPQNWDGFSKDFRVFSVPDIDTKTREEMDFVVTNQYHLNTKKKKALKIWPKVSSNINLYDSELTTVRPSFLKKSEMNKKDRISCSSSKSKRGNRSKANKCRSSSPLDKEDKNYGELLHGILTNSCTSSNSSNSSYKNLRMNLYEFDDEWQRESSPISPMPLQESILRDDITSDINRTDDSSLLDLSFQSTSRDTTISNDLSNLQIAESVAKQSTVTSRDRKPQVIGAFLKLPIKINNTNVTWVPTLNGKLPRKHSLKKLMSMFTSKRRRIRSKSKGKYSEEQQCTHNLESEQCSSSSSSQKSWYSESDTSINFPSFSPTFKTFGRANSPDLHHADKTNKSRIVLTELSREDLATNLESSKLISWIPIDHASSSNQANRQNVDSPSKRATVASFPKLKMSCEHLSLPKHPHLSQKMVPKHPFVAHTKIDQMNEKVPRTMKEDVKQETKIEEKSNAAELESSIASCVSALSSISTSLNTSMPKISDWMASSPNNIYDVPKRSKSSKSMTALDKIFPKAPSIYNIPRSKSDRFVDCSSPVRNKPFTRYATISLKNLRRLMSQEKLQTFGDSIEV